MDISNVYDIQYYSDVSFLILLHNKQYIDSKDIGDVNELSFNIKKIKTTYDGSYIILDQSGQLYYNTEITDILKDCSNYVIDIGSTYSSYGILYDYNNSGTDNSLCVFGNIYTGGRLETFYLNDDNFNESYLYDISSRIIDDEISNNMINNTNYLKNNNNSFNTLYSNAFSFATVNINNKNSANKNTLYTWGLGNYGGSQLYMKDNIEKTLLLDYTEIDNVRHNLKTDISYNKYTYDISINHIFSNDRSYTIAFDDNTIQTFGHYESGGVLNQYINLSDNSNITDIIPSHNAYIAYKSVYNDICGNKYIQNIPTFSNKANSSKYTSITFKQINSDQHTTIKLDELLQNVELKDKRYIRNSCIRRIFEYNPNIMYFDISYSELDISINEFRETDETFEFDLSANKKLVRIIRPNNNFSLSTILDIYDNNYAIYIPIYEVNDKAYISYYDTTNGNDSELKKRHEIYIEYAHIQNNKKEYKIYHTTRNLYNYESNDKYESTEIYINDTETIETMKNYKMYILNKINFGCSIYVMDGILSHDIFEPLNKLNRIETWHNEKLITGGTIYPNSIYSLTRSNIRSIYTLPELFIIITENDILKIWGKYSTTDYFGDLVKNSKYITNVSNIITNDYAFIIHYRDGSILRVGDKSYGGGVSPTDISNKKNVDTYFTGEYFYDGSKNPIIKVVSTKGAFLTLNLQHKIRAYGSSAYGASLPFDVINIDNNSKLKTNTNGDTIITNIYSNEYDFRIEYFKYNDNNSYTITWPAFNRSISSGNSDMEQKIQYYNILISFIDIKTKSKFSTTDICDNYLKFSTYLISDIKINNSYLTPQINIEYMNNDLIRYVFICVIIELLFDYNTSGGDKLFTTNIILLSTYKLGRYIHERVYTPFIYIIKKYSILNIDIDEFRRWSYAFYCNLLLPDEFIDINFKSGKSIRITIKEDNTIQLFNGMINITQYFNDVYIIDDYEIHFYHGIIIQKKPLQLTTMTATNNEYTTISIPNRINNVFYTIPDQTHVNKFYIVYKDFDITTTNKEPIDNKNTRTYNSSKAHVLCISNNEILWDKKINHIDLHGELDKHKYTLLPDPNNNADKYLVYNSKLDDTTNNPIFTQTSLGSNFTNITNNPSLNTDISVNSLLFQYSSEPILHFEYDFDITQQDYINNSDFNNFKKYIDTSDILTKYNYSFLNDLKYTYKGDSNEYIRLYVDSNNNTKINYKLSDRQNLETIIYPISYDMLYEISNNKIQFDISKNIVGQNKFIIDFSFNDMKVDISYTDHPTNHETIEYKNFNNIDYIDISYHDFSLNIFEDIDNTLNIKSDDHINFRILIDNTIDNTYFDNSFAILVHDTRDIHTNTFDTIDDFTNVLNTDYIKMIYDNFGNSATLDICSNLQNKRVVYNGTDKSLEYNNIHAYYKSSFLNNNVSSIYSNQYSFMATKTIISLSGEIYQLIMPKIKFSDVLAGNMFVETDNFKLNKISSKSDISLCKIINDYYIIHGIDIYEKNKNIHQFQHEIYKALIDVYPLYNEFLFETKTLGYDNDTYSRNLYDTSYCKLISPERLNNFDNDSHKYITNTDLNNFLVIAILEQPYDHVRIASTDTRTNYIEIKKTFDNKFIITNELNETYYPDDGNFKKPSSSDIYKYVIGGDDTYTSFNDISINGVYITIHKHVLIYKKQPDFVYQNSSKLLFIGDENAGGRILNDRINDISYNNFRYSYLNSNSLMIVNDDITKFFSTGNSSYGGRYNIDWDNNDINYNVDGDTIPYEDIKTTYNKINKIQNIFSTTDTYMIHDISGRINILGNTSRRGVQKPRNDDTDKIDRLKNDIITNIYDSSYGYVIQYKDFRLEYYDSSTNEYLNDINNNYNTDICSNFLEEEFILNNNNNNDIILDVYTNGNAYAGLSLNGNVYTWGDISYGGKLPNSHSDLSSIDEIFPLNKGFISKKMDKSSYIWSTDDVLDGSDSGNINDDLSFSDIAHVVNNIKEVYYNDNAILIFRENNTIFSWGDISYGGVIPYSIYMELAGNIVDVKAYPQGFIIIKNNGDVLIWGGFNGKFVDTTSVRLDNNGLRSISKNMLRDIYESSTNTIKKITCRDLNIINTFVIDDKIILYSYKKDNDASKNLNSLYIFDSSYNNDIQFDISSSILKDKFKYDIKKIVYSRGDSNNVIDTSYIKIDISSGAQVVDIKYMYTDNILGVSDKKNLNLYILLDNGHVVPCISKYDEYNPRTVIDKDKLKYVSSIEMNENACVFIRDTYTFNINGINNIYYFKPICMTKIHNNKDKIHQISDFIFKKIDYNGEGDDISFSRLIDENIGNSVDSTNNINIMDVVNDIIYNCFKNNNIQYFKVHEDALRIENYTTKDIVNVVRHNQRIKLIDYDENTNIYVMLKNVGDTIRFKLVTNEDTLMEYEIYIKKLEQDTITNKNKYMVMEIRLNKMDVMEGYKINKTYGMEDNDKILQEERRIFMNHYIYFDKDGIFIQNLRANISDEIISNDIFINKIQTSKRPNSNYKEDKINKILPNIRYLMKK